MGIPQIISNHVKHKAVYFGKESLAYDSSKCFIPQAIIISSGAINDQGREDMSPNFLMFSIGPQLSSADQFLTDGGPTQLLYGGGGTVYISSYWMGR